MTIRKIAGRKIKSWDGTNKTELYYPTLEFKGSELPELKDWEVGEEYELVIKVRMTSKSEDKQNNVRGSFDVIGAEPEDGKLAKSVKNKPMTEDDIAAGYAGEALPD